MAPTNWIMMDGFIKCGGGGCGKVAVMVCLVLVIGLVFICGCVSTGTVCNKPYYEYKVGECCLDKDGNRVCDRDEVVPAQPGSTAASTEATEKITATVSQVIDGDSMLLEGGGEVRLLGVNAPEMGQPYYGESTERLRGLVEGKEVVLEEDVVGEDQYGRSLRYVFLGDENVCVRLVREGYATVYIIPPNTRYEAELRGAWGVCLGDKVNLCKSSMDRCDNRCIGVAYFHWNAKGDDCVNLNDEYVMFKNSCNFSCDLSGWGVGDESSRDPYVFPGFVLGGGSTVTLYTGSGVDTVTELYWGSCGRECNAVWNNGGDTLYLRDAGGGLVLDYTYQSKFS
ncbi:MAG: lamin tail domain-containing protein [Candidatus Altiarchaeales archaeon]|nr:lamin tail domain-containing protein [Candidatus Altiarchaeales archaeon]